VRLQLQLTVLPVLDCLHLPVLRKLQRPPRSRNRAKFGRSTALCDSISTFNDANIKDTRHGQKKQCFVYLHFFGEVLNWY